MNKLTAEVARRHQRDLKSFQENPKIGLSLKEELYLQALEIALPVLEGRIKSSQLPSEVFNRLYDQYLMGVTFGKANRSAAKDFLEACLVAIHASLPVLEQQEKGESDWIQWHGGECPVPEKTIVIVRYRKGKEEAPGEAGGYFWHHHYGTVDIIAYRVVEQERERGEEE